MGVIEVEVGGDCYFADPNRSNYGINILSCKKHDKFVSTHL